MVYRDLFVDVFGEVWYEDFWPFVRYVIEETKRAFSDGFDFWELMFEWEGFIFSGSVISVAGSRFWSVKVIGEGRVVEVLDDRFRVGVFDENGDVVWTKDVLIPDRTQPKGL